MKSFKKALAVLLSVLMVVFSFPFSAMALENPYDPDGVKYATDYDVEVHVYISNYDCQYGYGYAADTVEFFDPTQPLKAADLSSEDDCFAVIVTVEGLDKCDVSQLTWNVDWTKVTPAEYGKRDALETGDGANESYLESAKTYNRSISDTGTMNRTAIDAMMAVTFWNGQTPNTVTVQDDCADDETFDGMILGIFGYQMLVDEINLQEVFQFDSNIESSFFAVEETDANSQICAYGAVNYLGESVENTTFIFPEWGITGPEEDTNTTYTFVPADGREATTGEYADDAAALAAAPTQSAAVVTANDDSTHTTTPYKWVVDGTNVVEVADEDNAVTADCAFTEEITPAKAATHTEDGVTAVMGCPVCGNTTGGETISAEGHDYVATVVPATCVAQGYTEYECSICHDKYIDDASYTEKNPNNHAGNTVDAGNAVEANCVTEGFTGDQICDACLAVVVPGENTGKDASKHVAIVDDPAVDPTCEDTGLTAGSHCEGCGETVVAQEEVKALGHAWDAGVVTKEATRAEAGEITYTCANDETHTYTEEIPALGVLITVETNEFGTATINGEAATGEAQKVAYGSTYTLVAAPADNAEFIGWSVNGKLVSEDAEYSTVAYADTVYTPVYEETDTVAFTVTFVDQFNNIIAILTDAEVAALTELPAPYAIKGYTFTGYDATLEDIQALETSSVVTANYEKIEDEVYTVTAPGCIIRVNGVDYTDTATVAHDAKVKVTPANGDVATSWTVNGNEASFAAEYTFYVTTDVTVAYSTAEVTAEPTVAAVNGNGERVEGSHQVRFLATRTVPEDYTLVESGFVYGKNVTEADLVLENVGNGVYLYKNSNLAADGQFALTFGVAAQTGTACARAYMIVKDAAGNASYVYADAQIYAY